MPLTAMRESRAFVQEMKFLISPACAEGVQEWARAKLAPDVNGGGEGGDEYRVSSLYLDTDDLAVYQRRGSYGRTKYRVRRYGGSNLIFLERKLKTRDRVGKLRSVVSLAEAAWVGSPEVLPGWPGRWFRQRTMVRHLAPVCQISYERLARQSASLHGPIRLTVDRALRATPVGDYAFVEDESGVILSPAHRILELKYRLEIPGLFKELLQQFRLQPVRTSKYRMAVEALGLKAENLCLTS